MLSFVDIGSTDAIQSALHTHRCRLDGYPELYIVEPDQGCCFTGHRHSFVTVEIHQGAMLPRKTCLNNGTDPSTTCSNCP